MGRLELERGRKRWAYGPQNASYSSERISARVAGVNTYLREPGIVSRAKRRRERGSDGLSRGFIVGGNFELKKFMMPDMLHKDSDGSCDDDYYSMSHVCFRSTVLAGLSASTM